MSIRMSMIGLVGSTVFAAFVVAGGCGGDKTTPAAEDGGTSGDVGGTTSTATDAGGSTATGSGGTTATGNGGTATGNGGAAITGYPTAGNGAYVCRKGVVSASSPAIAPGKNGVWGSATDVNGGMFAPYSGTDSAGASTVKLTTDTTITAGSVVITTATPMEPGWFSGFGLYMKDPDKCFDASAFTGIRMTISGTAGPEMIYLQVQMNDNYPIDSTNNKGACVGNWSTCTNNQFKLPALTTAPTAIDVPFASITGGTPTASLDPSQILGVQWQINCPSGDSTATCSPNITIGAVTFY